LLLLVGLFLTYLCKKLKVSNVLFLILGGILLSYLRYKGERLIYFSNELLTSIAVIALIMIVFDSTSRLRLRSIIKETGRALEVSLIFMFFCLIVISIATWLIFGFNWWTAILFSAMMLGTDPSGVLVVLEGLKHKAITFLEWESIINTPLTVIIPFMVIEMSKTFSWETIFSQFLDQIIPFLQQIVTGVGAGVVIFLIVFKILRGEYVKILTPVALLVSALLTYVLAESLGGSGVLAVTALGLMFGNVYVKKKEVLKTFGRLFSTLFEILVFLLLGLSIVLPKEGIFYVKALVLFLIYLGLRMGVVFFSFRKASIDFKEKLFIALNASKGVAVATVLFILISMQVIEYSLVDLGLLFILYSLILSTLISKMSKFFLKIEAKESTK